MELSIIIQITVQMKKKLDLNNLLAKYEGMSGGQLVEYSSPPHYESRQTPIEQQFYQTQNYQRQYHTSSQSFTGNFQMSKSECEQFLMKVKEELKNEERGLSHYADNAMKHVHQRFQANHEKIKREILQLLERAFQENQRYIREELKRQGHQEPAEFLSVHKKIAQVEEEINHLLYGLKGQEYRKAIAEVVMKDFNFEISQLRQTIKMAKQNYLSTLGEVEPDRQKIECIRRDLHQLFRLSKKNAGLVQKSLFSAVQEKFQNPQRVSQTVVEPPPQQPKKSNRKSFFNFGSD